ncbi:MAG: hypothetical protein Q8L38_08435 [Pseudohongiella sp.]|nr:hypothetical protein [Pseudohongiella sp.]
MVVAGGGNCVGTVHFHRVVDDEEVNQGEAEHGIELGLRFNSRKFVAYPCVLANICLAKQTINLVYTVLGGKTLIN